MEQALEVHRDLEVRVRRVRQEEARVLGGDAGGDHLFVELADLVEELGHLACRCPAFFDRLGHGVGELAVLVGDVALALLLERDADAMAHELVAEGARDAGDAELERDLLERAGVAGLQALFDEVAHLLVGDAVVVDALADLLRRELAVAGAVGHVERPHRLFAVRKEGDLDGHSVAPGSIELP